MLAQLLHSLTFPDWQCDESYCVGENLDVLQIEKEFQEIHQDLVNLYNQWKMFHVGAQLRTLISFANACDLSPSVAILHKIKYQLRELFF